jgi:hypothetical protein
MTEYALALNRDEVLTLADRVENDDPGHAPHTLSAYPLLLKLGSLYLELTEDGVESSREAAVQLTEAEAWLLRAKVSSFDQTATDPQFGVRLLRKLYAALLACDAGADVLPAAADNHEPANQATLVRLWKEGQDARDSGAHPDDPDRAAPGGAVA